jgi:hypothetical protein
MSTASEPAAACDVSASGPQSRYAAEWGLASLVLSGFLTLSAILMLILLVWYLLLISQVRPSRSDVQLAVGITAGLTLVFWTLTLLGIVAGWIGVRAAWQRCQPGGLPVVGLALSGLAFLLWTGVGLAVVMNMVDLSRRGMM